MPDEPRKDRNFSVYIDTDDTLAELFQAAEGYYDCLRVRGSWPEKGFLEGDVIIFSRETNAGAGDVVLIEEGGRLRPGLMSREGFLETPLGSRPLEPSERVVGVGIILTRALKR